MSKAKLIREEQARQDVMIAELGQKVRDLQAERDGLTTENRILREAVAAADAASHDQRCGYWYYADRCDCFRAQVADALTKIGETE